MNLTEIEWVREGEKSKRGREQERWNRSDQSQSYPGRVTRVGEGEGDDRTYMVIQICWQQQVGGGGVMSFPQTCRHGVLAVRRGRHPRL